MAPSGDMLFTVTGQSINQMMMSPPVENSAPFSLEAFTQLYQKIDFATRSKMFDIFLPKNAQLPKMNPPYPSSIFPN